MISNFIVFENYAIHFEEKHLDLHINFHFIGFSYNSETKLLQLNWIKAIGDWVPKDNPKKLSISISEVTYIMIIPRDNDIPCSEDSCLMDLTYYPSIYRDEDECIQTQEKPTGNDDIIFKFQNGQIIRVKGHSIIVELNI